MADPAPEPREAVPPASGVATNDNTPIMPGLTPAYEMRRHPDDGWVFADPYPMSDALVRKFHGLIRALCPPEPKVPRREHRIEEQVRRMMRYMQPFIALGFKATLVVLDAAPMWTLTGFKRLQDMPHAEASALLTKIADGHGPLSDLVVVVRAAVLAPYYDLAEMERHVGYDPKPFMEGRVALRERLIAGEAPTAADMIGPFSDTTRGTS